jgi:uncharacterized membrane protein YgdD (TMEM256/DUF423 family)
MTRTFIIIGALLGMSGVALGAFGAHGLEPILTANGRLDTFETASLYHLIHALALFAAAWRTSATGSRLSRWAGILLALGVLFFSGSLYVLAIFDVGFMGAIAPIGGTLMILGWGALALDAWRGQAKSTSRP